METKNNVDFLEKYIADNKLQVTDISATLVYGKRSDTYQIRFVYNNVFGVIINARWDEDKGCAPMLVEDEFLLARLPVVRRTSISSSQLKKEYVKKIIDACQNALSVVDWRIDFRANETKCQYFGIWDNINGNFYADFWSEGEWICGKDVAILEWAGNTRKEAVEDLKRGTIIYEESELKECYKRMLLDIYYDETDEYFLDACKKYEKMFTSHIPMRDWDIVGFSDGKTYYIEYAS